MPERDPVLKTSKQNKIPKGGHTGAHAHTPRVCSETLVIYTLPQLPRLPHGFPIRFLSNLSTTALLHEKALLAPVCLERTVRRVQIAISREFTAGACCSAWLSAYLQNHVARVFIERPVLSKTKTQKTFQMYYYSFLTTPDSDVLFHLIFIMQCNVP